MNHYSQNDEQEIILNLFHGTSGHLLEIGAFDGITFSNTRALLELGWSGVLVEPDPRNFVTLMKNSETFKERVELIPCAIAGAGEYLAHLLMDDTQDRGWSSTLTEKCAKGVLSPNPMKVLCPVIKVDMLCKYGPFDFINIDAEGKDFEILMAMPPEMFRECRLICVEPHDAKDRFDMKNWFAIKGWRTFYETPENLLVTKA